MAEPRKQGRKSRILRKLVLLTYVTVALAVIVTLLGVAPSSRTIDSQTVKNEDVVPNAKPSVIPLPAEFSLNPTKHFEIAPDTVIHRAGGNGEARAIAERFASQLAAAGGPALRVQAASGTRSPAAGQHWFALAAAGTGSEAREQHASAAERRLSELGPASYVIDIGESAVVAQASAAAGLFYAAQTLRQMLGSADAGSQAPAARPDDAGQAVEASQAERAANQARLSLPTGRIVDQPRYQWRGAMLDVARHFRTVAEVKRVIDLMALYKLNRLHLHLTDDQGWRLEIKSWQRLTEIGARTEVGGGPGGFYTQAEYAEIVQYAAERQITVVPEIDIPGHTNAALAAVPELNCNGTAPPLYTGTDVGFSTLCVGREFTYAFVEDVIREVAALTPGPYIHFGGDEARTLTAGQHAAFVRRVQDIIRRHGKTPIGWDEIAISGQAAGRTTNADFGTGQAQSPSAIVQWWQPRDHAREAVTAHAARGGSVILSPADRFYLDMKYQESTKIGHTWAGITSTRHAYAGNPAELLPQLPADAILGVEAALWSETTETMADVEHLLFPRLPGIAELAWSSAAALSWSDYRARLADHAPLWHALGINYYRSPAIPWSE